MEVACEVCGANTDPEEAEEFLGCDDDSLLLCKQCADISWGIPEMFTGEFGLLKKKAIRLVQMRRERLASEPKA